MRNSGCKGSCGPFASLGPGIAPSVSGCMRGFDHILFLCNWHLLIVSHASVNVWSIFNKVEWTPISVKMSQINVATMVRMVPEQLSSFVWEFPSGSNVQRLRKPCQGPVPEAYFGNQQQLSPDLCLFSGRIISISSISIHFIHVHSLKWGSFRVPTSGQHTLQFIPTVSGCFKQFPVEGCTGRSHASSYASASVWLGWMLDGDPRWVCLKMLGIFPMK